ncbi:MAG: 5'-methylthioadenosine/S-adenosylhomocysteine nucleosidase [Mangrovicoccus sp.]|nr:5'-methylthioadenosine/S-adenosylhomocysteine nucleosidase [Mangrovicoccus sp.]
MRPVSIALPALILAAISGQTAHGDSPKTAVISAFPPEWEVLRNNVAGAEETVINGNRFITGQLAGQEVVLFLSGISMVNAAMTTQLALDHFDIGRIIVSGIAGGVDPSLNIGDVTVVPQWGQYLDSIYARDTADGYALPPWMPSDFPGFGMMFPRNIEVVSQSRPDPEPQFWFPVDAELYETALELGGALDLAQCSAADACLSTQPRLVVGGKGVSGAAFVDNAAFRDYVFETFEARVLDMESAAIAHVAQANEVPFIAFRSLSDLAGGGDGENELPIFFELAANNAAHVVMSYLTRLHPVTEGMETEEENGG